MKERYLDNYPDVLTPEEAMKVLCIGRNKIYELLKSGCLKSLKIGKLYRIPKKFLQGFIDTCYNDQSIGEWSLGATKGV